MFRALGFSLSSVMVFALVSFGDAFLGRSLSVRKNERVFTVGGEDHLKFFGPVLGALRKTGTVENCGMVLINTSHSLTTEVRV